MPQFFYRYGAAAEKNPQYRRTMEDTHVHVHDVEETKGQAFFAIFDGHGGKKASSYCKHMAYKFFMYIKNKHNEMTIPEVFQRTFAMIDEGLRTKSISSGSTAAIAFLEVTEDEKSEKKTVLYTANVGDTRVILCRGGKAIRLSYDHKASDPQEQQRVTDAGGVIFGDRVCGSLAITRALGDLALKNLVVSHPYTTTTTITQNDEFLILACDGVWDVLSDQDAVNLIRETSSAQESSELLLKKSLELGSTDNVSIIVVKFQSEYIENPVEPNPTSSSSQSNSSSSSSNNNNNGNSTSSTNQTEQNQNVNHNHNNHLENDDDDEAHSPSDFSDPEFSDSMMVDI